MATWGDRLRDRRLGGAPGAIAALVLVGCGTDTTGADRAGLLVVAPRDLDAVGEEMVTEVVAYLETIGATEPRVARVDGIGNDAIESLARESGAGLVVVLDAQRVDPERFDFERMSGLGAEGFALDVQEIGSFRNELDDEPGATAVMVAANSLLGRQFAGYEVLRRLGVRFFHPEQEYVPQHDAAALRPLARRPTALHREGSDYVPDYEWRSWSFHSSHPLEQLEAFSDARHPLDEAINVTKWAVKNKGNRFKGLGRGVAEGAARQQRADELEALRTHHGFSRGAGITLHNEQQGASAEIDRDSDTPIREQIERIVEDKLAATPDARWFGIHFGPTEFTVTPDQETVQWINWAGQKALELRPGIQVEVNNHITGSQPVQTYSDLGCPTGTNEQGKSDYYDLAFHTDQRLGANVHTVMFYPLEGPARVYNQQTFSHKLCLMEQASNRGRPLTWFPEGSWWLSFDNTIPVYLPLYIWTRGRDIELVKPLLASRGGGTLKGHRMFNSGQEWGYWQQDYAVGLWAWNSDVTLAQVLGELFDPLCEPAAWDTGCTAKSEAIAVLDEAMLAQRDWFLNRADWQGRPGGLYSYFAGEDQADEIAATTGFEFRPVRVPFSTVNQWQDDALETFEETDLAALDEIVRAHEPWLARLESVRPEVPEAGTPWFDELVDGLEINYLRAQQSLYLYRAVVAYGGAEDPQAAQADWDAAQQVLARAEQVIRRREAAYRYPAEQTHGGGLTPDTVADNGTTYPYRVHTKTHLLTYWHNRNDQVRILLEGGDLSNAQSVALTEALDAPGRALDVSWPAVDGLAGSIAIGDVASLSAGDPGPVTLGPAEGYWPVSGELLVDGRTVDLAGGVARASIINETPASGVELTEPADSLAQGVLAGVFPALRWGWIGSSGTVVVAPDPDQDGSVAFDALVHAPIATGDASAFESVPVSLPIPVALSSGGSTLTIGLTQTVISGSVGPDGLQDPVSMEGRISVPDLVNALRELAGFDEAGALQTLSSVLGFDPQNPPASVPYAAQLEITAP